MIIAQLLIGLYFSVLPIASGFCAAGKRGLIWIPSWSPTQSRVLIPFIYKDLNAWRGLNCCRKTAAIQANAYACRKNIRDSRLRLCNWLKKETNRMKEARAKVGSLVQIPECRQNRGEGKAIPEDRSDWLAKGYPNAALADG
jgi:hypothetical protein